MPCDTAGSSEYSTLLTPATCAALAAAALAPTPASSTWMGPPSLPAAVTAARVALDTPPAPYSPRTRLEAQRAH